MGEHTMTVNDREGAQLNAEELRRRAIAAAASAEACLKNGPAQLEAAQAWAAVTHALIAAAAVQAGIEHDEAPIEIDYGPGLR
jgi:hypothetical protein